MLQSQTQKTLQMFNHHANIRALKPSQKTILTRVASFAGNHYLTAIQRGWSRSLGRLIQIQASFIHRDVSGLLLLLKPG